MEERETPQMHEYGESKTTRVMMAIVRHVTAWAGRTKHQAAWFLLKSVHASHMMLYNKANNMSHLSQCNATL